MKKIVSLLLVLAMTILAVAACGVGGEVTTTSPVTTETTTAAATTLATTTTETQATTLATTTAKTTAAPKVADIDPTGPSRGDKDPILHLDFEPENIEGNVIKNVMGTGLNATITGNPEFMTSPTGGSAIRFGTNSVFDFLTIANDERLNFTTSDDFTIDFWYMLDKDASGWENLFSKGSQQNGWYGVWLGTSDASNQGVCWGGDTGNWKIGSIYSKYVWHHITVVHKNGALFMYLDGKLVNETSSKKYVSSGPMYIGGRNSSDASDISSAQFNGAIDDFKIYDYAFEVQVKSIHAADSGSFTYTAANGDSITLPYRVYYPTDYAENSDKEYPILFFLHGHGENGTDNTKQLGVLSGANKLLDDIADMDNCIILAPQTTCDGATNVKEWVASGSGTAGVHQWDSSAGGLHSRQGALEEITYTLGLQAAEALLVDFIANNRVDEDRVYLGGISMGGCGTWELLARRPDLFAAAIPVCGSGIVSTAASLVDIDIWTFHGLSDSTVWSDGSKDMEAAIKAAGGTKIHATYFPGVGHSVWNHAYNAKNDDGLTAAQWLLQQTRAD